MAILIRPAGLMCTAHSNGWDTKFVLKCNQQKTVREVLTEPLTVGQIIMGSMVALPMARGP